MLSQPTLTCPEPITETPKQFVNVFKVNNKDITDAALVSLLLTLNRFHAL